MKVAVIGGGYAGMAAAATLAERRIPITVFEAARTLGGRARRVEYQGLALDNGLHVLIGAYTELLRLVRLVGQDPARLFLRTPLTWQIQDRLAFKVARLPAPLHMLGGLLASHGLTLIERLDVIRFMLRMRRRDYRLTGDVGVSELLDEEGQKGRARHLLWRPLCISALNTPPETASAQVFLHVLRDGLGAAPEASDLLLPRVDLSALFPEPASRYVEERGGSIRTGERVTAIDTVDGEYVVETAGGKHVFTHVICALPPYRINAFLVGVTALAEVAETIDQMTYQPIHSVYLGFPEAVRLPTPMLGFDSDILQWAFDRGVLCDQPGVIGLVISAEGTHESLPHDALADLCYRELQQQLGALPAPTWHRVIAEKRATFACRPGLRRPLGATPLRNFYLAGDYVASDYPATLESAVRSGVAAARLILEKA
jgi:squalene-associated FAD-dependent desaturase